MRLPYASTCTGSRIETDARPLRRPLNSLRTCSMALSMRFLISAFRPLMSFTSMVASHQAFSSHASPDGLAEDHAPQITHLPETEDDDWQLVVHAQRDRGRIHD